MIRATIAAIILGTLLGAALVAILHHAATVGRERRDPCATIRTCTPNPSGECAPIRRGPAVCGCVVVQGWWEDRVVCWEVGS